MIGQDRGSQVMCQLSRLASKIGHHPRRIGLSATIGDVSLAAEWLGMGTGRSTEAPVFGRVPLRWKLGLEHFYIENPNELQAHPSSAGAERGGQARLDPGYEFLYDAVAGTKALVFSNSREETEYVTATLRQIAKKRKEDDIFLIHHGNLSAALRETAETKMKDDAETRAVTCATVTLELGIDIGRLERVAQVGSATTVSGFLQRLGRSGRRGSPPEMVMVIRESTPLPNEPLPKMIPWDMLRGIAIVELYASERFIEPPRLKQMPMSLAFHQTLSILAASGELTAKKLAETVLSLPPFHNLQKDDYRELLVSMVNQEFLEMKENRGLIIGLKGERLINNFKFYAVFKDSEDYTVRCASEEIGTITTPPPVGDRFALAGRVWEVKEIDLPSRLIFVTQVDGKMEVSWPGDAGEIHTKVMRMMREVLFNGKDYPFLSANAKARLEDARSLARNTHMDARRVICTGGQSYVYFPWLGTRSFRTMRRFLKRYAAELGVFDIQSEGCNYITFKARENAAEQLESQIAQILANEGLHTERLLDADECPVFDKYDDFLPPELLRRAYAKDRLLADEILEMYGVEL